MIVCPNCWEKNEEGSKFCKTCGFSLNGEDSYNNEKEVINKQVSSNTVVLSPEQGKKIIKAMLLFCSIPFLIVSLIFICVGLYLGINGRSKTKNYIETTANFKDYKYCYNGYDQEICGFIHEYEVDGIYYEVYLDIEDNEVFDQVVTIYYDPKQPQENVLSLDYSNWFSIVLVGLVFVIIDAIPLIIIFKKL